MTQKKIIEQAKAEVELIMPSRDCRCCCCDAWNNRKGIVLALLEQLQDSEAAAGMERMGFEKVEQTMTQKEIIEQAKENLREALGHISDENLEAREPIQASLDLLEQLQDSEAVAGMERIEKLEDALHQITTWSQAYPIGIFPKPDLKKARKVLSQEGMTLDEISADAMRHVIEGVQKIIEKVLPSVSDANQDGMFDDHEG